MDIYHHHYHLRGIYRMDQCHYQVDTNLDILMDIYLGNDLVLLVAYHDHHKDLYHRFHQYLHKEWSVTKTNDMVFLDSVTWRCISWPRTIRTVLVGSARSRITFTVYSHHQMI